MAFIFTEWKEIKEINIECYENMMNTPIIFDGRNCYSLYNFEKNQVEYYSIGRKEILNIKEKEIEEVAFTIS